MPFSNGIFSRIRSCVAQAAQGLPNNPDLMDADLNDLANGLSNCVTRDGQGLPNPGVDFTGNLSKLGSVPSALANLGFSKVAGAKGHVIIPIDGLSFILQWNTVAVTTDQLETFDIPFPTICVGVVPNASAAGLTDGVYSVSADTFTRTNCVLRPRFARANSAGVFTGGIPTVYFAGGF